jgi:hypothetical protein
VGLVRPILALVHVGSALLYATGFLSAKTLTGLAHRGDGSHAPALDPGSRRPVRLPVPDPGRHALASGYGLTQAWVLASIVLYAIVVFIGSVVWRRRSAMVRAAADAGDDAGVVELLSEPRARLLGWVEVALVVVIVVLVLRPA